MQIHYWLHYLGLFLSLAMLIIRWLIWHFIIHWERASWLMLGKVHFYICKQSWLSNCYTAEPSLQSFSPVTKKMIQRSIKVPFLIGLNSSTEFAENFTFWNRRVPISYAIRVSKAKDQLGIPCVILNHAEPPLCENLRC